MGSRLHFESFIKESYKILSQLDLLISNSGMNKLQQGLIKIRTSQINNCDFCTALHTYDAIKHGEDPQRISLLSSWRDGKKWFSREEQLILALLEEVTTISGHGLSSEIYNTALDTFGKEKTGKLIIAVANINGWNRIAVSAKKSLFEFSGIIAMR
ncbi:carboxymuconolactone decarboxylase family protein [Flavobacterium sp. N1736]|uniref:carboxymuconolactone decarboxylase family protein n=1 Tax=Flavobacterium sp. N1736 TaxID=2986823 RepID=UPI002225B37D|nr:carboxymuconolactone decarboxylase family protein [Flavobacterium sp. N1736]